MSCLSTKCALKNTLRYFEKVLVAKKPIESIISTELSVKYILIQCMFESTIKEQG